MLLLFRLLLLLLLQLQVVLLLLQLAFGYGIPMCPWLRSKGKNRDTIFYDFRVYFLAALFLFVTTTRIIATAMTKKSTADKYIGEVSDRVGVLLSQQAAESGSLQSRP